MFCSQREPWSYGIDFWFLWSVGLDNSAEAFGLPHLDPFLKAMRSSFSHGANFACGGSRVTASKGSGPVTLNLEVQVYQFKMFKRGVLAADGCPDGERRPPFCSNSLWSFFASELCWFAGPAATWSQRTQTKCSAVTCTTRERTKHKSHRAPARTHSELNKLMWWKNDLLPFRIKTGLYTTYTNVRVWHVHTSHKKHVVTMPYFSNLLS